MHFRATIARVTPYVAVIALGAAGVWAQTPGSDATNAEARRVADRIRALEADSDRLVGEARARLADLRKLEMERDRQIGLVREARAAILEGQAAIERTAERLLTLESQRLAQLPALETQLVDIYKRGRPGYARLVLSAGGIREFGRATRAAAAMIRVSQQRVTQHRGTIEALARERTQLEAELDRRRANEADARRAQAAADKAVADQAALLTRIDAQRDANAQLAGELQVEQERLKREGPAPLAAAKPAVIPGPVTVSSAPAAPVAPAEPALTPLAPFKGALLWPVSGRVTGRFGRRISPPDDAATANGVEIASREGNPVRALHSGTVTFTGQQGGLGNLVIVDHGGNTQSMYGYLASISVSRDQAVKSGAELGRVGPTPSGTAAVYLEIRIDGRSVDPVQWLRPF